MIRKARRILKGQRYLIYCCYSMNTMKRYMLNCFCSIFFQFSSTFLYSLTPWSWYNFTLSWLESLQVMFCWRQDNEKCVFPYFAFIYCGTAAKWHSRSRSFIWEGNKCSVYAYLNILERHSLIIYSKPILCC